MKRNIFEPNSTNGLELVENNNNNKQIIMVVGRTREEIWQRRCRHKCTAKKTRKTATFSENDNQSLQNFADLCADVKSQTACMLGLASLNYPNIIQPIANKLLFSIRGKWEKEVVRYADKNATAYPPSPASLS